MLNKTVHTPRDVDYQFSGEIQLNTANARRQILPGGMQNKKTAIYEAPSLPANIPQNHNRLTVAMDVGFWGNYLSHHFLLMAARLKTDHYRNPGDNRSGAALLGSWAAQHGYPAVVRGAAIQEAEISNQMTNRFHEPRSHCITENKRYRLILDSILYNGQMIHEMRLKDHTTGLITYSNIGTPSSSFTHHYNTRSRLIMIAAFAPDGVPAGGSYSNLVSYWTLANEWVPDP